MVINKLKIMDLGILAFFLFCFLTINPSFSHAKSNNFPKYETAPKLTQYVSDGIFNNTYYISPSGDDTTGDGSINRPWATINGARTGGTGFAVARGDLVYFRGGTYTARSRNRVVNHSYYYIDVDGTSSDRIVFAAYPGEVPTFTANSPDHLSMTIEGDYIVFDSLTFTKGSMNISGGQHAVIQNCTFEGTPYNPNSSQISPFYFYVHDGGHHAIIRNNYWLIAD